MSKELIYGKSAQGIALSSTVYAFHNFCSDTWDKLITIRTPVQPAYTAMNKGWKKKY